MTQLSEVLAARTITPEHPDYDEQRALYNGMIDKRPAMIVPCHDSDEVAEVVNYARDNGLLLAIRGGGHNGPGLGSCDDGIMLDCSPMKAVTVDPDTRIVTVEPGLYDPAVGGVRIEDLVVVTQDGYQNLTDYPENLVVD